MTLTLQARMKEEAAAAAAAPRQDQAVQEEPAEADPFGLDAIIAQPKRWVTVTILCQHESSAVVNQVKGDTPRGSWLSKGFQLAAQLLHDPKLPSQQEVP